MKLSKTPEITKIHPGSSGKLPNVSWWSQVIPEHILDWFHDHHFFMFSHDGIPRARFSQHRFCDLEDPNEIHGLLTHPSGFPRSHFGTWCHVMSWCVMKTCHVLPWFLELWQTGSWAIWRPLASWGKCFAPLWGLEESTIYVSTAIWLKNRHIFL